MLTATLAFAGVAALINVTPGLDTLLVVRTSLAHGRTGGRAAALGILTGCVAWGLATAVGLTALLTASRPAYDTLRIGGALYLTWLGASALWRSRQRNAHHTQADTGGGAATDVAPPGSPEGPAVPSPRERAAAFRAGLGTNLLNPKAGIFYMSLIPQFIPHGTPVFSTTLLLTAIDVIELSIWYRVVSGAASVLGERARRPSFRRRMERVSGIAFLGFAANLLLADHA
ncbi:LysE family translocator [Streptomyces inhibens]|uniref:LysE family translocator n=1 Tax=Streptomyces inhibens TaxID=2293571 RepID=UPI001EE699D1|nr:LysE family translocator [Streptomyces inhibens]UKY47700.1 LysE family translocator [Streptomyces inhibens]